MEDLEGEVVSKNDPSQELYQELSPRGGTEYYRESPPPSPSGRRKGVNKELKEFTAESEILLQHEVVPT